MKRKVTKKEIEDIEREMKRKPKNVRRAVNPKHTCADS